MEQQPQQPTTENSNNNQTQEIQEESPPTPKNKQKQGEFIITNEGKRVNLHLDNNRNRKTIYGSHLTYHKKLENELDTLPIDQKKIFRKSLNKYQFQMEVYVPHSMVISKKEYYGKNYMLNNLVRTEDIIQDKKKFIAPISKETRKFSHQYELVRKENLPHQKKYLSQIQEHYENQGFDKKSIEYRRDDNIFNPSLLLDEKFGLNSQEDVVKYGTTENQKEYKKDKILLRKFSDVMQNKNRHFRNKNSQSSNFKTVSKNILNDNNEQLENNNRKSINIKTNENNEEYQRMLSKIKIDLLEEIKIKNMSKEEYESYAHSLKNDIRTVKKTLKDFEEQSKNDQQYNCFSEKKKNTQNSRYSDNLKNINDSVGASKNATKTKIIDYSSEVFVSSKGMKNFSNDKRKLPDINITDEKNNNYNRFNSKNTTKRKSGKGISKNNLGKIGKKDYQSESQFEEILKQRELNGLYNNLISKSSTNNYPYDEVSKYFYKFTRRRIPPINEDEDKKGSNIHGLVEELQNIIKEKNIVNFAKLNNDKKKDFLAKKDYNLEDYNNMKVLDIDHIAKLDEKIANMHFDFTENLLSNQKDEFHVK